MFLKGVIRGHGQTLEEGEFEGDACRIGRRGGEGCYLIFTVKQSIAMYSMHDRNPDRGKLKQARLIGI